jgi:flagellar L-ring protein precursor FlgH
MPMIGMANGSIYAPNQSGIVSGSQRARQVGDILTVAFTERFQATKNQNATTAKTSEFAVTMPPILGAPLSNISGALSDPGFTGGTEQAFTGTGGAAQSNSLTGRMSVSVVRVLPGGNLEIHGQKKLTLNNGDEYIRVRGIVRPQDISVDNVVLSERIAHAEIKYIGAGDIADVGKKGWLFRLFDTANPM